VIATLCGVLIFFIYFYFFEKLCQKPRLLRLEVMKKPTSLELVGIYERRFK